MKLESYILNDFFDILNNQNIDYCVMNNYGDMPEVIPSDVDFAIEEKAFNQLDFLVLTLANKHNVSVTQKIWHGHNKCAYILSPLDTEEYFWLQLDFFVDFCAKNYPNLIPVNKMLENKVSFKNFYVPKSVIEVPFIIQRRIIKGDLNIKHIQSLHTLYNENSKDIESELFQMFGQNLGQIIINSIATKDINLFNNNMDDLKLKLKLISKSNIDSSYKVNYAIQQIKRTFYRVLYPTGLSIGFIDGSKNSEIISQVDEVISGSFHGTFEYSLNNLIEYLLLDKIKIKWATITKRKVYIKIPESYGKIKLYFLTKFVLIKPDIVFDSNRIDSLNIIDKEDDFKKMTSEILAKQSQNTMKHMFNFLSPTAKKKD